MADPCVTDTAYIALDTTGTPAVLEATLRNPEETFSATLGDDTLRNVNDTGVQHDDPIGGWPQTIDNSAGSAPMRGIVVLAINPIFVFATDPVSIVAFGRLTIDGVVADERDMPTSGVDLPAGTSQLLSLGCLVGQIDVPAGDTVDIAVSVWVKNVGASGQWSFRFGGSKMVVQEGF
jgi:hypothetical protein